MGKKKKRKKRKREKIKKKKINKKRKKKKKKEKKNSEIYDLGVTIAMRHFWLFSNLLCTMLTSMPNALSFCLGVRLMTCS